MPLVDPSASVVRCARIVIVFAATIFEGYLTKTGPQARWKGVAGPVVRFEGSLRVDSNGFLVKDFLASVRGIVDAVFLDLFLDLILGRLIEDSEDGIFLLLVIHGQTSARCEKSESANQCERTKCHS